MQMQLIRSGPAPSVAAAALLLLALGTRRTSAVFVTYRRMYSHAIRLTDQCVMIKPCHTRVSLVNDAIVHVTQCIQLATCQLFRTLHIGLPDVHESPVDGRDLAFDRLGLALATGEPALREIRGNCAAGNEVAVWEFALKRRVASACPSSCYLECRWCTQTVSNTPAAQ